MGFYKDVKLLTNLGTVPFSDLRSGQTIQVLDKQGIWRSGTVTSYSNKNLQTVVFQKDRKFVEVMCDPRNRWILDNGYITSRLAVGHKIYPFCSGTDYHMSTTATRLHKDYLWTVVNIESIQGKNHETWSIIEPETNSFTLDHHIVTNTI